MKNKSQEKRIRPADYVIQLFGGVRATARAIGRSHASVILWRHTKAKGGCDGFVPSGAMHIILGLAEERHLNITAEDLLIGHKK